MIFLVVSGEGVDEGDSGNEGRSGSEEINVCEKCCAEFFKWTDFFEYKKSCFKNSLVLIVSEDELVLFFEEFLEFFSVSFFSD